MEKMSGQAYYVARGDGMCRTGSADCTPATTCKLVNETHNGKQERFGARCCSEKYTGHGPPHAPDWGGWYKKNDYIDSARLSSRCRNNVLGGKYNKLFAADWISPDYGTTKIKDRCGKLVTQPRGHCRQGGRWLYNQPIQRGCIRAKTWAEADAMFGGD